MTYTLTADQLRYLRADLNDGGDDPAFSDSELNDNFTRSAGNYQKTVVLCLEQLLAGGAKLYKYVAGFTRQEPDSVYDHLRDLLDYHKKKLSSENNQVQIVGVRIVPPKGRTEPDDA